MLMKEEKHKIMSSLAPSRSLRMTVLYQVCCWDRYMHDAILWQNDCLY